MSAPVDVLAVMARDATAAWNDRHGDREIQEFLGKESNEARAAVAELIEAADAYAEAEAALANREIEGINAESIDRLQPRVHAARRDLEVALARVKGGAV